MRLYQIIERLSDLTLDAEFDRKLEACFYLSSRMAPYYRLYALATDDEGGADYLRNHLLLLWSQYLVGSEPSRDSAAALEARRPTSYDLLAEHAETAISCALHLTWYLVNRDERSVRGCVLNYFDHIDYVVSLRLDGIGVRELTDILIVRSRIFREEVAAYERRLLDSQPMMNRPLLRRHVDRDVSSWL